MGIPFGFISALKDKDKLVVMNQIIDTYEKWCLRLSTARLNRWLRKVSSFWYLFTQIYLVNLPASKKAASAVPEYNSNISFYASQTSYIGKAKN